MNFLSLNAVRQHVYELRAEIALKKEIKSKMLDETVFISRKTLEKINKVLAIKTQNQFKDFDGFFNQIDEECRFKTHTYNVTYGQNETPKFDYLIFSRR